MKKIRFMLVVLLMGACTTNVKKLEVKTITSAITSEYGTKVQLKVSDFLTCEDADVLRDATIDTKKIVYKDATYPEVGVYPIKIKFTLNNKPKEDKFFLQVVDSVAPTFSQFEQSISIPYGTKDYDFSKHYIASDLSGVRVEVDQSQINEQVAGTYPITITASDPYDNKLSRQASVTVEEKPKPEISQPPVINNPTPNDEQPITSIQPTYVNGILVVNKKYGLPANYAPGVNGQALQSLQALIASMRANGLSVSDSYSGYRSYDYQNNLYWSYVARYGQQATDTFSARPGHSEHQTGLAFDLIGTNGQLLTNPTETAWVAQHAHEFGFIVRYQAGKEAITGYQAEPWHLRYVGSHAPAIYASQLTLEEYLGVQGGGY